MRKLLFILVMVFLAQEFFAQEYRSYFGKEFTKWYEFYTLPDYEKTWISEIKDNAEISIDGKMYKTLRCWYDYYIPRSP